MKFLNHKQLKILTLVSLICLLIPFSIFGLWIYVSDLVTTQAERVVIFKSYFPDFLDGRWGTTLLSITFCLYSIVFSSFCVKLPGKLWKLLNIIILFLSSSLLFLNLFSMM